MAKISIIVPVYNTEKYLERCLDSLVNQTVDDYEIIVIDDRSTDGSLSILERYQEMYPDKIRLIRNYQNAGIGATRNRGLYNATGEYIGFVDSDDKVSLDMYAKLMEAIEETKSSIARTNRKIVFHNINVSFLGRGSVFDTKMVINPKQEIGYLSRELPCVWNKLIKRDLIGTRLFPEDLRIEDYPFTIPLLYNADKVVNVPEVLYEYSMNPTGATVTNMRKRPNLLDVFKASDRIIEEIVVPGTSEEVANEINFIAIQNGLQKCRDVLYSTSISLKDKKELLSLLKAYITQKYGSWEDNPRLEESKGSILYRTRLKMIDSLIDQDYESMPTDEIEAKIKRYTKE